MTVKKHYRKLDVQKGGGYKEALKTKPTFKEKLKIMGSNIKKASGHVFKAPAYLVRGISSGIGTSVGLGATRLTGQAAKGIQLSLAKRAEKKAQAKVNVLTGMREKGIIGTRLTAKGKLTQIQKKIDNKTKLVESLTKTGMSGKNLLRAQSNLNAIQKKLKSKSLKTNTNTKTLQANALKPTINNNPMLKLRLRKLQTRKNAVASAENKYRKSKESSKKILSNTTQAMKKSIKGVADMSIKKTAALYTLAVLGSPAVTPMALMAMPIVDTLKAMGKDVPAVRNAGVKMRNMFKSISGDKAGLIKQSEKYEAEANKINFKIGDNMGQVKSLGAKLTGVDDTTQIKITQINELLPKINSINNNINTLKLQLANATDEQKRQNLIVQIEKETTNLNRINADYNNYSRDLYSTAKNLSSEVMKKDLEKYLDMASNTNRLFAINTEFMKRQRDTSATLLSLQKKDKKLLEDIEKPGSILAEQLNKDSFIPNNIKPNAINTTQNYNFNELKIAYDKAKIAFDMGNANAKNAYNYLNALLTQRIVDDSLTDMKKQLVLNNIQSQNYNRQTKIPLPPANSIYATPIKTVTLPSSPPPPLPPPLPPRVHATPPQPQTNEPIYSVVKKSPAIPAAPQDTINNKLLELVKNKNLTNEILARGDKINLLQKLDLLQKEGYDFNENQILNIDDIEKAVKAIEADKNAGYLSVLPPPTNNN
jgi:hypothetical protein